MKKNSVFLLLLAIAVCFVVPAGAQCRSGDPYYVVCFGDSTTAPRSGVVVYETNLQNELSLAGINATVYNKGIGGNRTDQGLARVQKDILDHDPNLVIIQFGINDCWLDSGTASVTDGLVTGDPSRIRYDNTDTRGYTRHSSFYLDNLTSIVQQIKAHPTHPRIIVMTPNQVTTSGPPQWRNDVLGVYAELARRVAALENVELLDIWQMYTDYHAVPGQSLDDLLKDGMHPNTTGQRMLTDALYNLLGIDPSNPPAPDPRKEKSKKNSIGIEMIQIGPGSFMMGQADKSDHDEKPVHKVTITKSFYISATEVTNAQYEQFDPEHKNLRGKRGLSRDDEEAVIFVSWNEATDFCKWLSKKEAKTYRLPTEAEWEYACRAGTTTPFNTGNELPQSHHKHQSFEWDPKPVSLKVGQNAPNKWGLYDMHGNVEEWCLDWYGPYPPQAQTDPVGYTAGLIKTTRGGSHNTPPEFLRSANRLGTLPEDKHWLIGFRVVQAPMPATSPLTDQPVKPWQRAVLQKTFDWSKTSRGEKPFFDDPLPFVLPPAVKADEPFYGHNHCPSITWCDNGDLLAVWFSTNSEKGREMTILASRLRAGSDLWDPSSEFFKMPDRNMTGSSLFNDGKGKLYHFNGLEAGAGWGNLALVMRTSTDNGITWSMPCLINPGHQRRNQVIDGTSMTDDGGLIQLCDAVYSGSGGTAIHISRDGGVTWTDPGEGTPAPKFVKGGQGGTIAGIHAGVVLLRDGRLLAFGRSDNIDKHMPMSVSEDLGQTWTYSASPFPPISSGQRLVLMRLRNGALLFASFTGPHDSDSSLPFLGSDGTEFKGHGLFAALSYDDGKSWPVRKLITPRPGEYQTWGHTRTFRADPEHAEPRGYLSATQTPDETIHLISSGLHYRFNTAWLKQLQQTPPPAVHAPEN